MGDLNLENNVDGNKNSLWDSTAGKIINNAVDLAIKYVLPDLIDDQVINIKDAILEGGFEAGFEELKNSGKNLKESVLGIITGEFESIEQMKLAVKDGGILDVVSTCIDKGLEYLKEKTGIGSEIINLVEKGKDLLINQITNNIEENYTKQLEYLEKIDGYCDNWKEAYNEQNIEELNNYYEKINSQMKNIYQIENIIDRVKNIENVTNIINNSNSFELSEEELELATKI